MMLYGTGVILRGMTATDLDYLAKFSQEPEVVALTGGRYVPANSQTATEPTAPSRTRRRWGIMTTTLELIGEIELDHIVWQRHEAELAICIARKEYWSRGLGTDAIRTLLRHAFADLGFTSVYLRVFSDNLRAIRAYQHCGFRKVGAVHLDDRHGQAQQVVLMVVERGWFDLAVQPSWNERSPQGHPAV